MMLTDSLSRMDRGMSGRVARERSGREEGIAGTEGAAIKETPKVIQNTF